MAVRTEPSSWLTMDATDRLWSFDVPTVIASRRSAGQVACSAASAARTSAAVSMMLNPLRLTTCSATVVCPSKRAVDARSSNVSAMVPRSPSVTTRSPSVLMGSA